MPDIFAMSAFWAFLGGAGYAGTKLSTALWGGREIAPRARRLAIAQFVIAMLLAPAAGHALTPLALAVFPKATLPSTALLIGLLFNAVWPLVVEPMFLRTLVADLLMGLAARMKGSPR